MFYQFTVSNRQNALFSSSIIILIPSSDEMIISTLFVKILLHFNRIVFFRWRYLREKLNLLTDLAEITFCEKVVRCYIKVTW